MLYVGNFGDPAEGYAQAALQYAMALQQTGYQNFRLNPVQGMVNYRQLPAWCEPLSMPRRTGNDVAELAIVHYTPDTVVHPKLLLGRRNVALTVTETTGIPTWLVKRLNEELNGLITPTQWNLDVLRESGVTLPMYVLPHTQGEYFRRSVATYHEARRHDNPWTFYYIGTWTPRKNPGMVLRAYLRAFPDPTKSDTRLVLKISRSSAVLDLIARIVEDETGSTARLSQDVNVFAEFWSDAQLAYLHAHGDCYVSAHYGEGWGIGTFQAALAGNRQISTKWSAPVEYLPHSIVDWVDYKMVDVAPLGFNVMFYTTCAGDAPIMCAEPQMDSLVAALQVSAAQRAVVPRSVVDALWDKYGWEAVGAQFVTLLNNLEKNDGQ